MRFTAGDGTTPLNYWFDRNTCNTTSTLVWVRIPSASGLDRVYMYYGNENATSTADGYTTFLFFDDFNNASAFSARWSTRYGYMLPVEYRISDSVLSIYSPIYWRALSAKFTVYPESRVEFGARQRLNGIDRWQYFSAFATAMWPWDSDRIGMGEDGSYGWNRNSVDIIYRTANGNYQRKRMTTYNLGNAWFVSKIRRESPSRFSMELDDSFGTVIAEKTMENWAWSSKPFYWTSWVQEGLGTDIDYVYVRMYVNPEPFWVVGEEETRI